MAAHPHGTRKAEAHSACGRQPRIDWPHGQQREHHAFRHSCCKRSRISGRSPRLAVRWHKREKQPDEDGQDGKREEQEEH